MTKKDDAAARSIRISGDDQEKLSWILYRLHGSAVKTFPAAVSYSINETASSLGYAVPVAAAPAAGPKSSGRR